MTLKIEEIESLIKESSIRLSDLSELNSFWFKSYFEEN